MATTLIEPGTACTSCGHRPHEGRYCGGVDLGCDCGRAHPCACNSPLDDNFARVPWPPLRRLWWNLAARVRGAK